MYPVGKTPNWKQPFRYCLATDIWMPTPYSKNFPPPGRQHTCAQPSGRACAARSCISRKVRPATSCTKRRCRSLYLRLCMRDTQPENHMQCPHPKAQWRCHRMDVLSPGLVKALHEPHKSGKMLGSTGAPWYGTREPGGGK
jgi:hypothetical protein